MSQKAQATVARHMASGGNWRFKSLLEAALPGSDITPREMARAWPDPGKKRDYRHLRAAGKDPEEEMSARMLGEKGSQTYRQLSRAADVGKKDGAKHLSESDVKELEDGNVLGMHTDHVCQRMLFAGADREEVDVLFREQLEEVIVEGAQQRQFARDAVNVINADTRRGDVSLPEDDGFARPTAQGSEIRESRENYTTVEWNTEKYAQGARLTDELVDQANVDLIERNMQFLGRNVENAINRIVLHELVDNAMGSVDRVAESDSPNYKALNRAIGEVDENDFMPDTYVSNPEFRTALFEDEGIRFADRSGSDETVRQREFDPLLDLDHQGASARTYLDDGDEETGWQSGDNVWGYDEAGDVGSVVYDSDQIHLVLYAPNGQDIEVKDYEDPIRDLTGVNARVHADSIWTQQRAGATVEYAE